MTLSDLIFKLDDLGIILRLADDKLEVDAPERLLTADLVDELRTKKKEIVSFLKKGKKRSGYSSIMPVERREYYELSSAQKRLFFLQQVDVAGTAYNLPRSYSFEGDLEKERLDETLKKIIERHESFRTSFITINDRPVQHVRDKLNPGISYFKSGLVEESNDIFTAFIRPFDLSKAPLFRLGLVESPENKYILLVDMHHIISDGTSVNMMVKEFWDIYGDRAVPPQRIQYKDYCQWQNSKAQREYLKNKEIYWIGNFSDEIPRLNLPCDYTRPAIQSFAGNTLRFALSEAATKSLRNIAHSQAVTSYVVIIAVFIILLSKLSRQEDIIVGSPTAGRTHPDLENLIGMFINTLPIRSHPLGEKKFVTFLKELNEITLEAFENQEYQFEDLVERVFLSRDMSRNPLFDVVFVMQNQVEQLKIDVDPENIDPSGSDDYGNMVSKFDITLAAIETTENILFSIEYCTVIFKMETIKKFIFYFKKIIEEVAADPNRMLSGIDIIRAEEKKQILYEFNDTNEDYPGDKTIHELFAEQAVGTPDKKAVQFKDSFMTYGGLDSQTDKLACFLTGKGVGRNTIVGIMVSPILEMVSGILGILKAGGTYLPISPESPRARIRYILKDSGTRLLLTQRQFLGYGNKTGQTFDLVSPGLYIKNDCKVGRLNSAEDLAYVIYTSGSTGNPKGVLIEHRSLVNLCRWHNTYYNVTESDEATQYANFAFDASVWEIFPYLTKGSAIHIIPEEIKLDMAMLAGYYKKNNITISFLPTQICEQFMKTDNKTLRVLLTGGDKLNSFTKRTYELYNNYGPTENTVVATSCEVEGYSDNIPIGRPISNNRIYILNKEGVGLQPAGVPGELCVSGSSLARGYLARPELTWEKFIDNPFEEEGKLYKTGDLTRWLPGGNIEFLGRIDDQVKIRGNRIELGEIENRLRRIEYIEEAVVVARDEAGGGKFLCAYIVSGREVVEEELNAVLANTLAAYMLPSYYIQLNELPLNANGKVDRKKLPLPGIRSGQSRIPPRNKVEEKLAAIWAQVLHVDRESIGSDSNFFTLGGHSLRATILVSKIHKQLNVKVPIVEIFKNPTVRGLGESILKAGISLYEAIKPVEKREYYPTSSAQKRLYFLQELDKTSTAYNIPSVMQISGKLDKESFERGIKRLIHFHEVLRTSFDLIDNAAVQRVREDIRFEVRYFNIRETEQGAASVSGAANGGNGSFYQDIVNRFIRPFDLTQAPLLRIGIKPTEADRYLLLFDLHHIIGDGTSMGIFKEDFVRFYNSREPGPLKLQYKDFSSWQNGLIESGEMRKQEEFWLDTYKGEIPKLNFPGDFPRPENQSFTGATYSIKLDEEDCKAIKKIGQEAGTTLFMTLLTVLYILLYRYTGQKDMIVGTGIMGRLHEDLYRIPGMFVNSLAIRSTLQEDKTFMEFLDEVKHTCVRAFDNQHVQFEELVDKLSLKRDPSRNPLFDVLLVVQNFERENPGEFRETTLRDVTFSPLGYRQRTAKFDLNFTVWEMGDDILLVLEYATSLFKVETAREIISNYIHILKQALIREKIKIKDMTISYELFEADAKMDTSDFVF